MFQYKINFWSKYHVITPFFYKAETSWFYKKYDICSMVHSASVFLVHRINILITSFWSNAAKCFKCIHWLRYSTFGGALWAPYIDIFHVDIFLCCYGSFWFVYWLICFMLTCLIHSYVAIHVSCWYVLCWHFS